MYINNTRTIVVKFWHIPRINANATHECKCISNNTIQQYTSFARWMGALFQIRLILRSSYTRAVDNRDLEFILLSDNYTLLLGIQVIYLTIAKEMRLHNNNRKYIQALLN